jgi:5-methylcytosine-specific restriction endonuclease McrA
MQKIIKSIYGNIALYKMFCLDCKDYAFIIDEKFTCCGKHIPKVEKEIIKREVEPINRRKNKFSLELKKIILEEQKYCCLYCERPLGSYVKKHGKIIKLFTRFDHYIPFSYSQNNFKYNFVAACQICNSIKSDLYFPTLEEARVYILNKQKNTRYE